MFDHNLNMGKALVKKVWALNIQILSAKTKVKSF